MTPYDAALHAIGGGDLTLDDGTFEILYLLDAYVVDLDNHDFEADLGANISHREQLVTSWVNRVFDANDRAITDPNNGQTVTKIAIVKVANGAGGAGGGGTAATNRLVCYQALAAPVSWDGTNDNQTFNASGIFRLGAA